MNKAKSINIRATRDKLFLSLVFLMLALSLGGLLLFYWNYFMEPKMRLQAQEQAKFIAQSQVGEIVEALTDIEESGDIEKVIDTMDHALIFSDPVSGFPFFASVSLEIDYDVIKIEEGSINITRGAPSCDSCFMVDVAIYSKNSDELIGLAWFDVSGEFFRLLSKDVRNNILLMSAIGLSILIAVWILVNSLTEKLHKQIEERERADDRIKKTLTEKEYLLSKQELLVEQLQNAKQTAERATKLKDNFISLVSHDLRSPISGIVGSLKILSDYKHYGLDQKKVRTGLTTLYESSKGLSEFVEKLLDISRLQTGDIMLRKQQVNTNSFVEEIIIRLAPLAAQKEIVIVNSIPANNILFADTELLGEVISNLLSNAIKFCSKGDTVTLLVPDGRPGCIAVKDTGPGISEYFLPNLLKHDIKTTSLGSMGEKGTGLGLPHCADIVKAHDGEMLVQSANGNGTVFTVVLPHFDTFALIVDDQQAHREIMKENIMKVGIVGFSEAENGEEALALLENFTPDLIITDLQMHGINGEELIMLIRNMPRLHNVPIIAASSLDGLNESLYDEKHKEVINLGANDFVIKPINSASFEKLIRSHLQDKIS